MKRSLWLAWLALLGVGCGGPHEPARSVVLVLIDTVRADHLGLYGYARETSPALDGLSRSAAVFERAFAPSSWTLPSVGSLFTGQLPSRHAAGMILEPRDQPRFTHLEPSVPSLGEILADAGFATAAVVNNPFLHPGFGLSRGFETWDYVFGNYLKTPRASQIVHWGLSWLDRRDERRFLLLLHLFDPHITYDAPPPVRGRFTADYAGALELPVAGVGAGNPHWRPPAEDQRFVAGAYDEELAFVDLQLARLFEGLAERGLLDETLVVVTSDHGEELFDHGGFEHGHSMHQEILRIPLLIWGRDVRPARIDAPVSLADLMPTLLEGLGLEVPAGLEGRSLWPTLTGGPAPAERALVAEGTLHGPDRQALLRWPWKLVLTPGRAPRLYDLSSDPGERRNLAKQQRGRVAALRDELEARTSAAAALRAEAAPVEVDEQTRQQLEGLGYLR